jgi:predicted nuclease with TOPRIM domain
MQTAIELAEALLLAIKEAGRAHALQIMELQDRVNDQAENTKALEAESADRSALLAEQSGRIVKLENEKARLCIAAENAVHIHFNQKDRIATLEAENAELRKQNGHLSGELIKSQDRFKDLETENATLRDKNRDLEFHIGMMEQEPADFSDELPF